MNNIHVENLHIRLAYLEELASDIMLLLQRRFDAGIVEEIPAEVQVARAADAAIYGEGS